MQLAPKITFETPDSIDERVKLGMEWLDGACPGWEHKIKLDRLAMGDCRMCVLGQLAAEMIPPGSIERRVLDYEAVLQWAGWNEEPLDGGDPYQYVLGFEITGHRDSYRDLTYAWENAIAGRLGIEF